MAPGANVTSANVTVPTTTTTTQKPTTVKKISKSACEPWPEKLKPYQDCCVIPYYANETVERQCFYEACKKMNFSGNATAQGLSTDCYFKSMNLTGADGKFNKESAKAIYRSYSELYKNYTGEDPWSKLIDEAVDKCEFPTTANKTANMILFYICTNWYLRDNCVSIDSRDECDAVQEQYEKCKGIKPDCKAWPIQIMLPEFCCVHPELITTKLRSKCQDSCKAVPVHSERALCTHSCIYKTLAVKTDGHYDFEAVKKALLANSNKAWESSIDKAVDSCKEQVEGALSLSN